MAKTAARARPSRAVAQQPRSVTHVETLTASSYSGPLPPAQQLAEYEAILPGAADRIITVFEKQAQHRMNSEATVIHGDIRRATTGLWLGAVVAITLGVGSLVIIDRGHPVEGLIGLGIDGGSIVGTFVYGSIARRNERAEHRQMNPKR